MFSENLDVGKENNFKCGGSEEERNSLPHLAYLGHQALPREPNDLRVAPFVILEIGLEYNLFKAAQDCRNHDFHPIDNITCRPTNPGDDRLVSFGLTIFAILVLTSKQCGSRSHPV